MSDSMLLSSLNPLLCRKNPNSPVTAQAQNIASAVCQQGHRHRVPPERCSGAELGEDAVQQSFATRPNGYKLLSQLPNRERRKLLGRRARDRAAA